MKLKQKMHIIRTFGGKEELEAVRKVIESKYLTEGPVTQEFEKKFAKYVGAKHGIAVTSCAVGIEHGQYQ